MADLTCIATCPIAWKAEEGRLSLAEMNRKESKMVSHKLFYLDCSSIVRVGRASSCEGSELQSRRGCKRRESG